jgi:hypothetical protein
LLFGGKNGKIQGKSSNGEGSQKTAFHLKIARNNPIQGA